MVAHLSVLSAASSPCGRYFAFGTNFGFIYVFLLEISDKGSPNFTVSIISKLPYPGGVYSLITSANRLYAASVGYVANISWENLIAGKRDSEFWFPHVCKFVGNQTEPKIVAGGTSSSLLTWDHTGEMLADTNLGTDPATRLLHVLTVTEVFSPDNAINGRAVPPKKSAKSISNRERKQAAKMWFTGVPSALVKASQDAQESTAPDLVKAKSFSGPTKRIAMDCEFVGVGFDGKDSALARVSIVNQFGHLLMDEYVRPKEKITNYRTAVSGITPAHMRPGGPAKDFDSVHQKVAELCKGRILVGHAVHNDLKGRVPGRSGSLLRPI
ncbi:unnamed protein product [Dibothriocephalus latus]|uniref:Exonuclease domain-containing protein n=1 Tax=Dibothriocephalus latus TaxID=60516 RepID=A0A3P7LK02_DIBLA|nr:unnamed protein product [Dibothriocephalus latus]